MQAGASVRLFKPPRDWNRAMCATPQVGVRGIILDPASAGYLADDVKDMATLGKVCLRVLSTDMGYKWRPGDDLDWKYMNIWIHSECLEEL